MSAVLRRSSCGRALGGWLPVAVVALTLATTAGCEKKLSLPVVLNRPPTLTLTQAPTSSTSPYFYAYQFFWSSFDPDGRVAYYLYTVDPPAGMNAETTWVRTTQNRMTFQFRSDDPDSLGTLQNPGGFHTFAIKAVDDQGASSELSAQSFFSYTVAPSVKFIKPVPNALLAAVLVPTTTLTWTGFDPDGQTTNKPVKYKYKLFSEDTDEFPFFELQFYPDSLRRFYAPAFAGWDSISGDTVQVTLLRMTPNKFYVFAVVAIDEAGAYSPAFNFNHNLLQFTCSVVGNLGPKLQIWSDYFNYTYPSGGYNIDPASYIQVEVPSDRPLTFQWAGIPENGRPLEKFRWTVDIENLEDATPRTNERTDWKHWSAWGLFSTSAIVGPYSGTREGETHVLYVEAEDSGGLRSLGAVQFKVVRPAFDRSLLFVDDTRRAVDRRPTTPSDTIFVPGGSWPGAAELDTFFFARGGVRWRNYPAGAISSPGIFKGYRYDTLGTRGFPGGTLPISLLSRYRHIVWYTDAAKEFKDGVFGLKPMTALRFGAASGLANSAGLFSAMGGKLWMMGGGIVYNTLIPFNLPINDVASFPVFDSQRGELTAGRVPYDLLHWKSKISTGSARGAIKNPALNPTWPGAPDYGALPAELVERTTATDPMPPLRNLLGYYLTSYEAEVLTQPNEVTEDVDPDPDVDRMASALDTLYLATSANIVFDLAPVMTYYHGSRHGPVLFSGFPMWHFTRSQTIEIGDFVLQRLWGLPRDPVSRDPIVP